MADKYEHFASFLERCVPDIARQRFLQTMDVHKMKRSTIFGLLLVWLYSIVSAIGSQEAVRGQALQADALRRNTLKSLNKETSLRLRYRVLGDYVPLPRCSEKVRITELERAKKSFSAIQQDTATFHAIVQHLGLPPMRDFGVDEQFLVYREYERLNAVQLEPAANMVSFRIGDVHQPNCVGLTGYPSSGSIDAEGNVSFQSIGRVIVGVNGAIVSRPLPPPTHEREKLDHPELRYMLLKHFGDSIACGPYLVSAATQAAELARFPAIRQDSVPFHLLLQRLGLADVKELSNAQELLVIREYSKLLRIQLEPLAQKVQFKMLVRDPKHSFRGIVLFNVDGLIDLRGDITELKRAPGTADPCPK